MNLKKQKQLVARALDVSPKRVKFNITDENKTQLKEIISRQVARELVEEGSIKKFPKKGTSRTRANKIMLQKKKARRRGHGSRKGTTNARMKTKKKWILKIRALRRLLKKLRRLNKINSSAYQELYKKAKGNMFRNKKHMIIYSQQHGLLKTENEKQK